MWHLIHEPEQGFRIALIQCSTIHPAIALVGFFDPWRDVHRLVLPTNQHRTNAGLYPFHALGILGRSWREQIALNQFALSYKDWVTRELDGQVEDAHSPFVLNPTRMAAQAFNLRN
jgi:hypothetical protein